MLSDDVLLEIFDFCQKNHHPSPRYLSLPDAVRDWEILAHVCQRWRQVVFASPLRLNLRIYCTYGTPVRKSLDIWPTFPIRIQYLYHNFEESDEDNVIAALEHPDRVYDVGLDLTGQQLKKMVTMMQKPFPALKHLYVYMFMDPRMGRSNGVPSLPSEFLGGSAPCLQSIQLFGIPFPTLPALLLSTSALVKLCLDIPQTGYVSPEAMVAGLATSTRLEDLDIIFPASLPDHMRLPPATRTVLPALTTITFRGVREYLENFVARIDAPRLHNIWIGYFNQLFDFEVPHLWQFIGRSENLNRPMCCSIQFDPESVIFATGLTPAKDSVYDYFENIPRQIDVHILCEGIDWQVSHLAQALNYQTFALLSNVLHFNLAIGDRAKIPESEDMDDIDWLELLRPFSSAQTLFVSKEFAGHVSRSLENTAGVMATNFLPALDILCLEDQPMSSVYTFVAARSEFGRPVTTVDTKSAFQERLEQSYPKYNY